MGEREATGRYKWERGRGEGQGVVVKGSGGPGRVDRVRERERVRAVKRLVWPAPSPPSTFVAPRSLHSVPLSQLTPSLPPPPILPKGVPEGKPGMGRVNTRPYDSLRPPADRTKHTKVFGNLIL